MKSRNLECVFGVEKSGADDREPRVKQINLSHNSSIHSGLLSFWEEHQRSQRTITLDRGSWSKFSRDDWMWCGATSNPQPWSKGGRRLFYCKTVGIQFIRVALENWVVSGTSLHPLQPLQPHSFHSRIFNPTAFLDSNEGYFARVVESFEDAEHIETLWILLLVMISNLSHFPAGYFWIFEFCGTIVQNEDY